MHDERVLIQDPEPKQGMKHMKSLVKMTVSAAALMAGTAALADDRPAALIISQGGLGDASWNDTAFAGQDKISVS